MNIDKLKSEFATLENLILKEAEFRTSPLSPTPTTPLDINHNDVGEGHFDAQILNNVSTTIYSEMDESKTLDALANILTDLAQKPYDVALHSQHIRLAQSAADMESEVHSAREMMSDFLAAGEEVWLPLVEEKQKSLNFDASDDLAEPVQELLALYARAEADYLCAPLSKISSGRLS